MVSKFNYLSVFSPNEMWGKEKPEHYRQLIHSGANVTVLENARAKLALYSRFDPAIPHNRIVGQVVAAFFLENPIWAHRLKCTIAKRDISRVDYGVESIAMVDFGKTARQISAGIKPEEFPNCIFKYSADDFGKNGIALLHFRFLPCEYVNPIIFSVRNYVSIDDTLIQEDYKLHSPAFNDATCKFVKYVITADNKYPVRK